MTGMDDLVTRLRAQLDVRAAMASEIHRNGVGADCCGTLNEGLPYPCDCGEPELVLAEVDAKRAMIDWSVNASTIIGADGYNLDVERLLQLLASCWPTRTTAKVELSTEDRP